VWRPAHCFCWFQGGQHGQLLNGTNDNGTMAIRQRMLNRRLQCIHALSYQGRAVELLKITLHFFIGRHILRILREVDANISRAAGPMRDTSR
jgi:hypothetical protein